MMTLYDILTPYWTCVDFFCNFTHTNKHAEWMSEMMKEPKECIKLLASSQRKMAESQKSSSNTAGLDKNRILSNNEASIDMTKEEYYFRVLGLGHLCRRKVLHCFCNTYESIRLSASNKVGSVL
jgi:hypothetical protein